VEQRGVQGRSPLSRKALWKAGGYRSLGVSPGLSDLSEWPQAIPRNERNFSFLAIQSRIYAA